MFFRKKLNDDVTMMVICAGLCYSYSTVYMTVYCFATGDREKDLTLARGLRRPTVYCAAWQ